MPDSEESDIPDEFEQRDGVIDKLLRRLGITSKDQNQRNDS